MSSSHFYLESENKKMTPAEYGYWLVRWSHDGAMGSVDDLKASRYSVAPIVKTILKESFAAYLHYLAIYIASYWFYASIILNAQEATQLEMKRGLDDGIKSLRNGADPFDARLVQYLRGAISVYMKAAIDDYDSKIDSAIYNPDINSVGKKHIEMMSQYYDNMTEIDRFTLGHFVADTPAGIFKSMRDEFKLKLR